ncbi:Hint domain-containing protein [Chelatococcus reniformis]|uniref:Hint domain-containing protein n=1 Tax=Chelatococcus reniformis TaxID=1494448 RepID=UPI0016682D9D|nr:Hint domain-containing protein [Chelatococcus reniformis]
MATYIFEHYYGISSNQEGAAISSIPAGVVRFDIHDDARLNVGDPISIMNIRTFPGGNQVSTRLDGIYLGLSDAGEPFFSVSGDLYFASSEQYDLFSPSPLFDELVFCFLTATMIMSPEGERAVEELAIGDLVLTCDGLAVPVKWIGRQTLMPAFGLSEERRPVFISAGALGEGLPVRDLRVTSDHALLLDGVLVQAGALVNGTTIRRMTPAELGERLVVYHIELDRHDLVVADGVAAETFVDNVARRRFDNYAEFVALYGADDNATGEIDLPRVKSARQLPAAVRQRIEAAAERPTVAA